MSEEYFDLCHEDTFDLTAPFLQPPCAEDAAKIRFFPLRRFEPTIPPHLSEEVVAQWDLELW